MQAYASCPGSGQSCSRHECPLGMKTDGLKSLNALIALNPKQGVFYGRPAAKDKFTSTSVTDTVDELQLSP